MISIMPFKASNMRQRPDQFCDQLTRFTQYFQSEDFIRDIVYSVLYVGIVIHGDDPQKKYPSDWDWVWTEHEDGWKRVK